MPDKEMIEYKTIRMIPIFNNSYNYMLNFLQKAVARNLCVQ